MNTRRLIFAVGWLLVSTAVDQVQAKPVELKDIPKPAQKAVQLWLAGGTLGSIDQVEEKGRVTYEVDFTNKAGRDRGFTVADNGTLLSLQIFLAEAPAAVQKAIKSEAGTDKLDHIEKSLDGDEQTYDIVLVTKEGKDRELTLDRDGKVISRQVSLAEVPEAVQRTIKAQAGANSITDIEKLFDPDNTITFQIALTDKNGVPKSFTVDGSDGRLESVEIDLAEAPALVQKTVANEMGTGQFESMDKILDAESVTYEIAYHTKAGSERRFTVGVDGKLNSREVDLSAAPLPVQATIKQQLGTGKILRIDHSFTEKDSGVFPFQVQAEKDGKPFNFSVGPKGRFLGMDD